MIRFKLAILVGITTALSCSLFAKSEAPSSAASASAKSPNSSSPAVKKLPAQRLINLTNLYNDTCAKCHGLKAEGGGSATPSLNTWEKYDQKWDKPFFDSIKNGVKTAGMDSYGETMSDETIWGLVVHIRELQTDALRAQYGSPKPVNGAYRSKYHSYTIETAVDQGQGLKTPWSISWLPTGQMLVSNKPGGIVIVQAGKVVGEIKNLPPIVDLGQGGQMEVAVHPNYAKNGWIYLTIADPKEDGTKAGITKVVRGKIKLQGNDATWYGQETIFESPQSSYNNSGVHFGSKIAFDGKGHLYFSHGERGSGDLAQDLTKPNGKIYRVNEDGSIPSDNPFAGPEYKAKGYLGAIWSYGHRNPQGLSITEDGTIFDTEHGPRGGDEINRIQKGANYGWPLVCFSINYNDSPLHPPWPTPDQNFTMPIFRWIKSIGTSGLKIMKGNAFPKWKGDLIAGGLSGANVDRVRIYADKVVEREELLHGMGRVREIAIGPDGFIYVALNQPDKIIVLKPAK